MNIDYLKENPEYIDILSDLVEYEESIKDEDGKFDHIDEESVVWENTSVGHNATKLYHLESNGFIERTFDTNSTTLYTITDRDKIKSIVKELSGSFSSGEHEVMHDFPSVEELEELEVFSDVVGYDDIKWLMRKAMSSDGIINIILYGPPGCGKTVFLRCIRRLEDASFISGKKTSESGFNDEMFENNPRFMCIDELDDMDKPHQEALADYTEEGVIVETKGNNKRRELHTNTKTFASANSPDDVLPQIDDRFTDLHLEKYSLDEFIEICESILPREYGTSEEHAEEIARAVWGVDNYGNVRKAEDVAELSDGGDPKKVLEVLDNYSKSSIA